LALPVGIRSNGRPAAMLIYSTFLKEPDLLAIGYDLEQEINVRRQPQFLNSIVPVPLADLCQGHVNHGTAHLPHGRIF
jgi:hypothetical protein